MDPKEVSKAVEAARQKRSRVFHASISQQQAQYPDDLPAKGPLWVSRVTALADGSPAIVQVVQEVIRRLGDGTETYEIPTCVDVKAEWVGYRSDVDKAAQEPEWSEEKKYSKLMGEVENDRVMLYAHGGAAYVGNAAFSRPMTSKLAAISHSRVFAVNYRLAPQAPFPAQLVDLLLAYLTLLYPPPGSLHAPVAASKIVLVGDSFGAVLLLALTQILLTLNDHVSPLNHNRAVHFHGNNVHLPLPAGLAFISPYSYSNAQYMRSWEENRIHDSFPFVGISYPFFMQPSIPRCPAWPTNPPRGDIWCNTSMLAHPLVAANTVLSWRGCPPAFFASGQECVIDSAKMIANKMARDGVTVEWEEYQGMCHIFMTFFPRWKNSEMCYERWVDFVRRCINQEQLTTKGCIIGVEDLKETAVDVSSLSSFPPSYGVEILEEPKRQRRAWVQALQRPRSAL